MKPATLLMLCFLLAGFNGHTQTKQPKKVALIVAISKYQDPEWGELSSLNDVPLIKDALIRQGFDAKNIAVITEKQATLAGIKAAIDRELIQKVDSGDIAVFHFSGHGQQMDDDNGDEGDGLDEALVPYDGPIQNNGDGGADRHLRDDVLKEKLDQVRKKLGTTGDFLVILDACHSGTATRGLAKTRGTTQIYHTTKPNIKKSEKTYTDNYGIREEGTGRSPMACYFASAPSECNQEAKVEGKGMGSLSLAFYRAMSKAEKDSSYRSLFESIKIEMASLVSMQTPMAEGDLDRTLFAGKALGRPKYFQVQKTDKANAKKVTVPFGRLFGVFEGTTVNLYKPDTRDTSKAKPIARGKVTFAGEYTSDVELDTKLDTAKLMSSWIYLDEVNYGDLGVKVTLRAEKADLKKSLSEMFKNVKQATVVDDGADLFVEQGTKGLSPDSIYINDAGGRNIWTTTASISPKLLEDSLIINIGDYARSRYLRSLDLQNKVYKVTVQFVPVTCVSGCGTRNARYKDGVPKTLKGDSLYISFKDGDKFKLKILNQSNQKRLYYTILDIQPDNKVNVLIPSEDDRPEDFLIPQGDEITLDRIYTISPPFGTDMLKIIASDVPIDLRSMVGTRGAASRGAAKSPFEKILQSTYNAENTKTRAITPPAIKPDAVNIETISFNILSNNK